MKHWHRYAVTCILAATLISGCGPSNSPAPAAKSLHEAALFAPAQIPDLVANGAAIDKPDADGNTPLWLAARNSKTESVRLLLSAGADPDARGGNGWTPLHTSAFCWSGPYDTDVISQLIAHGADVNSVEPKYGETPLHYAVRVARSPVLVQLLIDAGADVDAQSNPGKDTPLQFAVAQRDHTITELLLQAGASPSITNSVGFVPQQQAPEDERIAAIIEQYTEQ